MTKRERVEKIKEGVEILRKAGVIINFMADDLLLEIIVDQIEVNYSKEDGFKTIVKDIQDGQEIKIDISKISKVKGIGFRSGIPFVNTTILPEKRILEPSNVKVVKEKGLEALNE